MANGTAHSGLGSSSSIKPDALTSRSAADGRVAFSFFAWSSGLGAWRRPRGRGGGRAGGRGRGEGGWERQPVVQLRRNPAEPSAYGHHPPPLCPLVAAGVFFTRRRCNYTPRAGGRRPLPALPSTVGKRGTPGRQTIAQLLLRVRLQPSPSLKANLLRIAAALSLR